MSTQTRKAKPSPSFTPEMRDLQARGKNPYQGQPGDEDESPAHLGLGQSLPRDTYEDRERRNFAMAVLDSPERLMMYAQSEGDSVAGQRLRFMRMLCGMECERKKKTKKDKDKDKNNESKSATSTPRKERDGQSRREVSRGGRLS